MYSRVKTPFGYFRRSLSHILSNLYSPIVPISIIAVPFALNYLGVLIFNWPFHEAAERYKFERLTRRVNAPEPAPTPISEQFTPPSRFL